MAWSQLDIGCCCGGDCDVVSYADTFSGTIDSRWILADIWLGGSSDPAGAIAIDSGLLKVTTAADTTYKAEAAEIFVECDDVQIPHDDDWGGKTLTLEVTLDSWDSEIDGIGLMIRGGFAIHSVFHDVEFFAVIDDDEYLILYDVGGTIIDTHIAQTPTPGDVLRIEIEQTTPGTVSTAALHTMRFYINGTEVHNDTDIKMSREDGLPVRLWVHIFSTADPHAAYAGWFDDFSWDIA